MKSHKEAGTSCLPIRVSDEPKPIRESDESDEHLAAMLCSAEAISPSLPWTDLATTLHPWLTTGSQPEAVLQRSETFSILASPSKCCQPHTGALQLLQAHFPRSACSPLSPELQPRLAMNNVLNASDQCASPGQTQFLSTSLPTVPFSFCTAGPTDTRLLVASCKDSRGSHLVDE